MKFENTPIRIYIEKKRARRTSLYAHIIKNFRLVFYVTSHLSQRKQTVAYRMQRHIERIDLERAGELRLEYKEHDTLTCNRQKIRETLSAWHRLALCTFHILNPNIITQP